MSPQNGLKIKDLKAWIEIDGRQLPCYEVEGDQEDRQLSCWIASEENKYFTVNIRQGQTKYWTQATLYFDGHKFQPETEFTPGTSVFTFESVASLRRGDAEMPFMFAKSPPSEGSSGGHHGISRKRGSKIFTVQKPGTITVEIRRETSSLPLIPPSSSSGADGMTHRIVYGKPREKRRLTGSSKPFAGRIERSRNVKIEVIAIFTFWYCPIETLRERGIVSRSEVAEQNETLNHDAPSYDSGLLHLSVVTDNDDDDDDSEEEEGDASDGSNNSSRSPCKKPRR